MSRIGIGLELGRRRPGRFIAAANILNPQEIFMRKFEYLLIVFLLAFFISAPDRLAANPAGKLVGIWRSQVPTPFGLALGELILKPDGSFSKTFRAGELATWDVGRYTVGQGYIHLTIEDHEPKFYQGKPMQWVTSETIFFQFVNPDRLICEDRIMGTRWQAYRVR
jgi:hypothetical protein